MYCTKRSMPARSPAGRYTDWSTLKPLCGQVPHVLDHFRLDLVLGQVQGEHRFLPGRLQPLHVEFGQFQELALRGKRRRR